MTEVCPIYTRIIKEVSPNHCPVPTYFTDNIPRHLGYKVFWFFLHAFFLAFLKMQELEGAGDWRFDCRDIADKSRGKSVISLRTQKKYIEYSLQNEIIYPTEEKWVYRFNINKIMNKEE